MLLPLYERIREKAREYNLFNEKIEKNTKELLIILGPFSIIKDKNILNAACEIYSEKGDKFNNFLDYLKS